MSRQVRHLHKLRMRDADRFGPKAATLGELSFRGFDVPGGFAISPAAFMSDKRLDESVEKEVLQLYEKLGSPAVAVRSSSLAEDAPDRSSAGQFETFLNVSGERALLDAISNCASSGSGAADYLRVLGAGLSAKVAVLVQEMVKPDAAGVLFTADPVSGRRDHSVVEAVAGLGDTLVSGRIEPARWVLVSDGNITESPSGDVPLEPGMVKELAQIGRRVEAELGRPQDIEWALAGGKLKVLQSRPITTLAAKGSSRDVWTTSNVVENLPGVVSPMIVSVMMTIERLTYGLLRKVGFPFPEDMRLLAFRSGRGYLNFGAFYIMADTLPGARREDIDTFLGGLQQVPRPERLKVSLLRKALILVRTVPIMYHFLFLPLVERERSKRFVCGYRRLAAGDLSKLGNIELIKRIGSWWQACMSYGKVSLPFTSRAFFFWGMLERLLRYWLGPESTDLTNRLLTGQSGLASTRPVHELWKLSRKVLAEENLKRAIYSPEPLSVLEETDEGRKFRKKLDSVLHYYCYRCDRELDAAVPRLYEDYKTVFGMLQSFVKTPEHLGPGAVEARQRGVYLEAAAEAKRRLGPLRWMLARPLLRQARRALAGRDRTKSVGSMAVAGFRLLLLEAGSRAVRQDMLEKIEDVFYLQLAELFSLLAGRLSSREATALVVRRKRRQEAYMKETPPDVIVGDINAPVEASTPEPTGETLEGMGVSAGRVTGRARIIMGKEDFNKLRPGEILVAPWTDPGWTSLFLVAGALVADVGGMLSHGSIVAREIGIPAVTNVRHGTLLIRDGQLITVDGGRGVVELQPGESEN